MDIRPRFGLGYFFLVSDQFLAFCLMELHILRLGSAAALTNLYRAGIDGSAVGASPL
jgi:hypothetical protein